MEPPGVDAMGRTLGELAVRFGCELRGEPATRVTRVAALAAAGPGDLVFVAHARYAPLLAGTRASAAVLDRAVAANCPPTVAALIHANPHATFARIAAWLHPAPAAVAGIHRMAVVASDARIAADAEVAAGALVGAGCVVGAGAIVGPGCVLQAGARLGAGSRLVARVVLGPGVQLGEQVLVQPGAVIGGDGFGFAFDGGRPVKVPQLGSVRIGDEVEIGANTAIDRGALDDTVIGRRVKIDNLCQIGHNVQIGDDTLLAGMVGVAGSTRIGQRCQFGGAVGIVGHLSICDDVIVTGASVITHSIDKPGIYSGTIPAGEARGWRRIIGRLRRLDHYVARLARVERATGIGGGDDQSQEDPT